MDSNVTLKSIFANRKNDLSAKLSGLSLPENAQQVQSIVTDYLNNLFESEGVYRQHLTQSEDYILQSAMSLLSAQQSIATELTQKKPSIKNKKPASISEVETTKPAALKKEQYPIALGGTALGGAAGAFIGTWGAVFGAIAGTAIALYFTSQRNQQTPIKPIKVVESEPEVEKGKPIDDVASRWFIGKPDADVFVGIIENICQSVDTLIGTFRAQIHRVVDKYESIQKPTLEGDYVELLENVQALLGAHAMEQSNENRTKRIEQRIQLLAECLENYSLQSVNYDGNNKEMFNFQPSANVTTETMVLPAIIKEGKVVLKGKVFTAQ